jgi:hypothetical protein
VSQPRGEPLTLTAAYERCRQLHARPAAPTTSPPCCCPPGSGRMSTPCMASPAMPTKSSTTSTAA